MIGIYKIENLINGKKYIGKTTNIATRFGDHRRNGFYPSLSCYNYPLYCAIRKYGIENFDFSVVEECLEEELNDKEKYWIEKYEAFGPKGYNQTLGGDGYSKVSQAKAIELYKEGKTEKEIAEYFNVSNRTIIEILHSQGLAYLSQDDKNKLQKPKAVCQYDLEGNFIAEYYSAGDGAKQLQKQNLASKTASKGPILKACNEYCTAYGFLWRYKEDDSIDMKQLSKEIKNNEENRRKHVSETVLKRCSMPVNQYDLNGKYITSFSSASEARRAMNNQHISEVCNGKWLTAAKFYWRYVSEDFPKGKDLNINEIAEWRKKVSNK